MADFEIRFAQREDTETILRFIHAIAQYEIRLDEVVVEPAQLERELFDNRSAEVLLGFEDGKPVGYALFCMTFSSFLGRKCMYLDDIYINEENRSNGYGKRMLRELAQIAEKRECGRMEWRCLKWNDASLAFYRSIGAQEMDEWIPLTLGRAEYLDLTQ